MTREEFEAVLALQGKYCLLTEPSNMRPEWVWAGLIFRGVDPERFVSRVRGAHGETESEAITKLISSWEAMPV